MQISIAVEELFVNIAHYAYVPDTGEVTISIEIHDDPGMAEITFTDRGIPYDPLEKYDPDVSLSAEKRKIGGLGIYMVKKSMDLMKYEYTDGCNIVTICKYF
jgi:anti-sigma regulatory factor (Ser/Thr protein kinase)